MEKRNLFPTFIVGVCTFLVFFHDRFYQTEQTIWFYRAIALYFLLLTIQLFVSAYPGPASYLKSRSYNPGEVKFDKTIHLEPVRKNNEDWFEID